ncbi:hypothetical protein ATJ88_3140 [Isoptericola jiangsuensis]|uniref:Uncharacterized protein n=1 Tax=Isoptericola jiangsuensis TaxID=548579 RepID=A0A2A9F0V3_9MICO|nr:hypothetical protein [Isoptericola jiangsuensis]PFG44416.1 hypothetical protein ATJ88_3140 [Isoptericola jiangsuensis]
MPDDVHDGPPATGAAGDTGTSALVVAAQRDATLLADYLARRGRAAAVVVRARDDVAAMRRRLADESADVARLESFSATRVWAALRGDRAERLDAERAQQQAAEYAVATAEARCRAAEDELAAAEQAVTGLGNVASRRAAAFAAREAWLVAGGGEVAAALSEVAATTGRRQAEIVEIDEADAAAVRAGSALAAAARELDRAAGWSTYDTFLGGDWVASMAKHDRLDRAAELVRTADAALSHLAVELGDVGERGVGPIGVEGLSRTFDIWFDNVFSDWAVAGHIKDAQDRVTEALGAVDHVRRRLVERRAEVDLDLQLLERRRADLLLA